MLQLDLKNFEEAESVSRETLAKFPSQPVFYLIYGVARNELKKPKEALESLETGLDYIIEDDQMEADFYQQMSVAYTLLNNTVKAKTFSDKAKQLESSN